MHCTKRLSTISECNELVISVSQDKYMQKNVDSTQTKVTKFWVHFHHISVREDKLLLPLLLAHEDDVDLLCSH